MFRLCSKNTHRKTPCLLCMKIDMFNYVNIVCLIQSTMSFYGANIKPWSFMDTTHDFKTQGVYGAIKQIKTFYGIFLFLIKYRVFIYHQLPVGFSLYHQKRGIQVLTFLYRCLEQIFLYWFRKYNQSPQCFLYLSWLHYLL